MFSMGPIMLEALINIKYSVIQNDGLNFVRL